MNHARLPIPSAAADNKAISASLYAVTEGDARVMIQLGKNADKDNKQVAAPAIVVGTL